MASGKNNTYAQLVLESIFQATFTAIANLLANASGSPITNLYLSLHNGALGATSSQTTNETAYTNYARVAVVRTSSGWSISSETISNAALVSFAQCGASGDTLTYIGIGTASSGTGQLLYFGALTSSLAVSNGITPQIAIGALTVVES